MKKFELKEEHIKLLTSMYVDWENGYDGAPVIDTKRPYGNSSVPPDIHEILTGEDWNEEHDDEMPEKLWDYYMAMHNETGIALQIVLCCKTFEPGVYVMKEEYDRRSWERMRLRQI